jgi:endonuclease YncB( thermonuclease family)
MASTSTGASFLAAAAGVLALVLTQPGIRAGEPLRSEGPVAVAEVLAGDLLRLSDSRVVRLAGVRVPAADAEQVEARSLALKARAELGRLLDGHTIRLAPVEAAHDRYGRLVAHIERSDGLWLQGALLEQGLAQVQTRPGEAARAAAMLGLEQSARAAGRGLWAVAAFLPQDAGALHDSVGRFRIVRGRVLRVAPTESHVYLNFGADWRADFTVRVRRAEVDGALAGTELEGLAGRLVEVRGVVLEAGGPLIELSHPEQLQVLP